MRSIEGEKKSNFSVIHFIEYMNSNMNMHPHVWVFNLLPVIHV